jgi:hypothetical protein
MDISKIKEQYVQTEILVRRYKQLSASQGNQKFLAFGDKYTLGKH